MNRIKIIRGIFISCFALCFTLPLLCFNFEDGAVSEIDNRTLAENPVGALTSDAFGQFLENYINDRIGFRDKMIRIYTELNDQIWGKMVHPTYTYGKKKEVFGVFKQIQFSDYHSIFLDMLGKIQAYCEERGTPFLFALEGSKNYSMANMAPEGMNFDTSWRESFVQGLRDRKINYVDSYDVLKGGCVNGNRVYNVKYDVNHWNSLGAYYGVNQMLERMQKSVETVNLNDIANFTKTTTTETTLPVSEFRIAEDVDNYSIDIQYKNLTDDYSKEVYRDPKHMGFGYFVNEALLDSTPKTLVFQGSYMNGQGAKYLMNALGQYIYVHDYENVINFEYYYNIFQPDYVIFEVVDYTLLNAYFNRERMEQMNLHPSLAAMLESGADVETGGTLQCDAVFGDRLATVTIEGDIPDSEYIWFCIGQEEYAYILSEETPGVTMEKDRFLDSESEILVYALKDGKLTLWNAEWK